MRKLEIWGELSKHTDLGHFTTKKKTFLFFLLQGISVGTCTWGAKTQMRKLKFFIY